MMNFRKIAPFALIPLAACAPEVEARLYLQDIVEVSETGETTIVPALLRIPENSEDSCKEGLVALAGKLAEITPLKDAGECLQVDSNQFSQFTIDLPIVQGSETLETDYLVVMRVAGTSDERGDGLALSLQLTRTLTEVQDLIGRGESSGFSLPNEDKQQPKFIFDFENDTRDAAILWPDHVFVDDAPGLPIAGHSRNLDRRDSVKLVFSDVVSAYVAEANTYTFATVFPAAN